MKKVFNLFGQASILPKMKTHFRRTSLKDIFKSWNLPSSYLSPLWVYRIKLLNRLY